MSISYWFSYAIDGGGFGRSHIVTEEPITTCEQVIEAEQVIRKQGKHDPKKALVILSFQRITPDDCLQDVAADLAQLAHQLIGSGQLTSNDVVDLNRLVGRVSKLAGGAQ